MTGIVITKLDILDSFKEIKVCVGYKLNGKKVSYYDGDAEFLEKVTPVYKTFKGWDSTTNGISNFKDLPKEAKEYIKFIEEFIGVKIKFISTGSKRNETIKV